MVDAGAAVADFLDRNVEVVGQFLGGALDRMAKAYLADLRVFRRNRPGVDRHRVDVLEEDCLRADLDHVVADLPEVRHGADAAHDAADAKGVGDGLAQAERLRHLEVGHGCRLVAADLEGDHDEVRAIERAALVGEGLDRGADPERGGDLLGNDLTVGEPVGVDVHQVDLGAGERGALQHVADDVLHEDGRAGSDERDDGIGRHGGSSVQAATSKAARTSRWVYSVLGAVSTSATGPCSTILPFCITMTRWQRARTTFRSWEMKR